ncbi:SDR family oxidoreductase [Pseudonocardia kujensis]|uniref:SDR family oxidoreductase n=1 Tax=Pseudonocardia kujensis TaxID=1128675 RepID=UPI001E4B11A5|nr:SDR family oxidoreductase [Pseudonocardia kujensis]MCE0763493.1 SDR family oxidoreductase [Pseudonocardia kujensis]
MIGLGGIGIATARRLGAGRHLVLADNSSARHDQVAQMLADEGHDVDVATLDITDRSAVGSLAHHASGVGPIAAVVHTAGISATMANSRDIYRVDLVGAAHVIEEFCAVAVAGTSMTCIASRFGYRHPVDTALEDLLAMTPADRLLLLPELDVDGNDLRKAYHLAKRGVQLRVRAAASAWGKVGARINSVSPGITLTPMSRQELEGPSGARMRASLESAPVPRAGTPDEIAAAVAFLSGPEAAFITGTDLLVDGGGSVLDRWAL